MLPDPGTHVAFYLAVLAVIVVLVAAQRFRFLRTILNLLLTAALGLALVTVLSQRERFNPYLSRIAAALHLGDQQVVGQETRIRMAPDGHFWAWVSIDGVRRHMLIDSGATVTALSTDTAAAAHLKVSEAIFPLMLRTANGTITADTATVKNLRLGDISAPDLPVVVSPAFGDTDVIGMNFLSKLKSWRVEGSTLILVPHHPEDAGTA